MLSLDPRPAQTPSGQTLTLSVHHAGPAPVPCRDAPACDRRHVLRAAHGFTGSYCRIYPEVRRTLLSLLPMPFFRSAIHKLVYVTHKSFPALSNPAKPSSLSSIASLEVTNEIGRGPNTIVLASGLKGRSHQIKTPLTIG